MAGVDADLEISIVVMVLPNEAKLLTFGRLKPACCEDGRDDPLVGDKSREVIVGRCLQTFFIGDCILLRSAIRDGDRVCAKQWVPIDVPVADPVAGRDHSVRVFAAPLPDLAQLLPQVVAAEGRRVGAKLSGNCWSPFRRGPPVGTSAVLELALLALLTMFSKSRFCLT